MTESAAEGSSGKGTGWPKVPRGVCLSSSLSPALPTHVPAWRGQRSLLARCAAALAPAPTETTAPGLPKDPSRPGHWVSSTWVGFYLPNFFSWLLVQKRGISGLCQGKEETGQCAAGWAKQRSLQTPLAAVTISSSPQRSQLESRSLPC